MTLGGEPISDLAGTLGFCRAITQIQCTCILLLAAMIVGWMRDVGHKGWAVGATANGERAAGKPQRYWSSTLDRLAFNSTLKYSRK
jgi:hypothetical protein